MRFKESTRGVRARMGRWSILGAAGVLVLSLGACKTDLTDPDLITSPTVLDTANIQTLRNGVIYEFGRAYSGPAQTNGTPGIIGVGGVLSDEMWYASTFPTMKDVDQRHIINTNGDVTTAFRYLQRARNLADRTAEQYAAGSQANSEDHALVTNLGGYSLVFLAENFCGDVPLGSATLVGAQLTYGPGMTTDQLLDQAIAHFDAAITMAQGNGSTEQLNLARVGKARALLDKGDVSGAAAVAADVPADFEYDVEYSDASSSPNNGIWQNINSEQRSSVATSEGQSGLTIHYFDRGETPDTADLVTGNDIRVTNTIDPRAPADSAGGGGVDPPLYAELKYPNRGADIPLATGTEAQLIQAEALLNGGQSAAYLPILNELRADANADAEDGDIQLAPLTDPGTPEGRVRQLFHERALWMWLTAHRLGDMRREVRQYGFDVGDVYPTGKTIFGLPYGDDVNLPVPFSETNNPEYDPSTCVTTQA